MRFPHPVLLRLLLTRGIWLWLGTRLMLWLTWGFMLSIGALPRPSTGARSGLDLGVIPSTWYLLALAALAWADLARRREFTLLGNLGIARSAILVTCLPAVLGEVVLRAILR